MYIPIGTERRSCFDALYQKTKNALSELHDRMMMWYRQYRGSGEIDGSSEAATATRNITYEIIESQVDSTIPAPKVDTSRYSTEHDRNAKAIERLCARERDRLPYEELNDLDERYTYIYGGSVWLAEWDSSVTLGGERGGIKLCCIPPTDFFPQPGIGSVEDMEYCFLRFRCTPESLSRRYGVAEADIRSRCSIGDTEDTAEAVVCYYRDSDGHVCRFVWTGEVVLDDCERYFCRKVRVCKKCGSTEEACSCETAQLIYRDVEHEEIDTGAMSDIKDVCGEVLGEKINLPYYEPRAFPIVIRKNTTCDSGAFGQSDCEYIRPVQQQINKVESRIMQKLMRSAITPVVPEDAQISLTNQIFGQVIKLRPGESAADYGTVDTTPDISKDIIHAGRLYDHARRIIGISDSYVGLDNTAISGYSRQLQLSQSAGRLQSKRRMKHFAYAELDRLIFMYYLAFADEARCVTFKDAEGRSHNGTFCRYDFLEYDPNKGYYYDDSYLFSVDKNGVIEGQREEMWKKNLENLKEGTLGDPSQPATLLRYWQSQERVHYPYARENVEYFRALADRQKSEVTADGEQLN